MNSMLNRCDWWWAMPNECPAEGTFVPVVGTSDQANSIDFSGEWYAWPLNVTIGNIHKDICRTPTKQT
jgi:hypothetical protein